MATKPKRISEHVIARAELFRPILEERWRTTIRDDAQLYDYLINSTLDAENIPEVKEAPPDYDDAAEG